MTAADVLAGLGSGARLHDGDDDLEPVARQGSLSRVLIGRAYVYELATTVDGVDSSTTARQMRRLLEGRDDRAGVLARFVADLDPEDERVLAQLLRNADEGTT